MRVCSTVCILSRAQPHDSTKVGGEPAAARSVSRKHTHTIQLIDININTGKKRKKKPQNYTHSYKNSIQRQWNQAKVIVSFLSSLYHDSIKVLFRFWLFSHSPRPPVYF